MTDPPPWPQARHKHGAAGPARVPKLVAMGVCAGREGKAAGWGASCVHSGGAMNLTGQGCCPPKIIELRESRTGV